DYQGGGGDGTRTHLRLSELFTSGKDSLVIYNFMFPRDPGDERPGPRSGQTALLKLAEGPCPSCVALLDQLGAAEHVTPLVNFAVVAKAPLARVRLRGGARLETATASVLGRQQLQRQLRRGDGRRTTAADAERVSPRRRGDPTLLGLGALLPRNRPRTGTPPRRHHRRG